MRWKTLTTSSVSISRLRSYITKSRTWYRQLHATKKKPVNVVSFPNEEDVAGWIRVPGSTKCPCHCHQRPMSLTEPSRNSSSWFLHQRFTLQEKAAGNLMYVSINELYKREMLGNVKQTPEQILHSLDPYPARSDTYLRLHVRQTS